MLEHAFEGYLVKPLNTGLLVFPVSDAAIDAKPLILT
jgi:hypothetical protein